jgi:hypothetical protein
MVIKVVTVIGHEDSVFLKGKKFLISYITELFEEDSAQQSLLL